MWLEGCLAGPPFTLDRLSGPPDHAPCAHFTHLKLRAEEQGLLVFVRRQGWKFPVLPALIGLVEAVQIDEHSSAWAAFLNNDEPARRCHAFERFPGPQHCHGLRFRYG